MRQRHTLHPVFTCEHGGNQIPPRFADLFRSKKARAACNSHRGWDEGALDLAGELSRYFRTPLFSSTTCRLIIDLNRSETNHSLFSEFMAPIEKEERDQLIIDYHRAYHARIKNRIASLINGEPGKKTERTSVEARGRRVLHVAVHSFTPVMKGEKRRTDIGLLFDPGRTLERSIAEKWQSNLRQALPDLCISRNAPYRGVSDGLTKILRKNFPDSKYAGIELEINQRHTLKGRFSLSIRGALIDTLQDFLDSPD